MAFDPKRIDRLAAKATLLEEQVGALVKELEELAEAAHAESAAVPIVAHDPEPAPEPEPETPTEAEPDPEPEADAEPEPASAPANAPSSAPEGARLVALNMALRGTPRDETARYLLEKYDFGDSDALLDDVYAKAGL